MSPMKYWLKTSSVILLVCKVNSLKGVCMQSKTYSISVSFNSKDQPGNFFLTEEYPHLIHTPVEQFISYDMQWKSFSEVMLLLRCHLLLDEMLFQKEQCSSAT